MHNTLLSSVYILVECARASVEREIVIHARPLTIKGGTLSYSSKKKKKEQTAPERRPEAVGIVKKINLRVMLTHAI